MSFSKEVKEELSRQFSQARHCQIAEIAALVSMCGTVVIDEKDNYFIKFHTENLTVARKYFILVKNTFLVVPEISIRRTNSLKKNNLYTVWIRNPEYAMEILKAVKMISPDGEIREELSLAGNLVMQNSCCRRAFIRGAFLAYGSISDPSKAYHFEIVTFSKKKAEQLKNIICYFNIDAKIVIRKKQFVVYVKEGSQISDMLNIMEAHKALMEFENIRILKEMRNSINRQVNCETANINKTVTAASKQVDDIKYIRDTVGLSELSKGLEEIARLRIEHDNASLKELGEMLNPPIGKSGVNHRLRKISAIADALKEEKERK